MHTQDSESYGNRVLGRDGRIYPTLATATPDGIVREPNCGMFGVNAAGSARRFMELRGLTFDRNGRVVRVETGLPEN